VSVPSNLVVEHAMGQKWIWRWMWRNAFALAAFLEEPPPPIRQSETLPLQLQGVAGRWRNFCAPVIKGPTCYLVVVATTSDTRNFASQLAVKDKTKRMFLF